VVDRLADVEHQPRVVRCGPDADAVHARLVREGGTGQQRAEQGKESWHVSFPRHSQPQSIHHFVDIFNFFILIYPLDSRDF
jgi:hypothetical protein